MAIRADYNPETRILTHDGEEYDLTTDEGLRHIRELLASADPDIEITARDMTVYQDGWSRAAWAIHPDSLEAYTASMGNQPHYHGHNSLRSYGRTGHGRLEVDDDGRRKLVQDLHFSTPLGLRELAHTGDIRASVGASETKASRYVCSICGENWLENDCDHWLGDVGDDGESWKLYITDMIHRETSTTHRPACDGTGSDAALDAHEWTLEAPESFRTLTSGAINYMRAAERKRYRTATENLRTKVMALEAQVEDLAAERSELAAERERLEREKAQRVVRSARQEKALRTPNGMTPQAYEDSLITMYLEQRSTWDLMIASVPDSQLSRQVSGSEPAPPMALTALQSKPGTSAYYSELAQRAREVAAETGENPADVLRRLRKESA